MSSYRRVDRGVADGLVSVAAAADATCSGDGELRRPSTDNGAVDRGAAEDVAVSGSVSTSRSVDLGERADRRQELVREASDEYLRAHRRSDALVVRYLRWSLASGSGPSSPTTRRSNGQVMRACARVERTRTGQADATALFWYGASRLPCIGERIDTVVVATSSTAQVARVEGLFDDLRWRRMDTAARDQTSGTPTVNRTTPVCGCRSRYRRCVAESHMAQQHFPEPRDESRGAWVADGRTIRRRATSALRDRPLKRWRRGLGVTTTDDAGRSLAVSRCR